MLTIYQGNCRRVDKGGGEGGRTSPLPDPNKFVLPLAENMSCHLLMLCFKRQA